MPQIKLIQLVCLVVTCLSAGSAGAVFEKGEWPWNLKLHGYHDQAIADKLGEGFFMNVGPTGIRARITHEHPASFTVKFVFDKSPAAGKINPGDVIVGANGKYMEVPHQFGRRTVTGWDGPMTEMAKHIEDSQGSDGKLELIVWPGGERKNEKKVELQIEAVGRFSETFPFNCSRSDKLMIDLCDFLANEYKREGNLGRVHVKSASVLALMASGDNKYSSIIREVVSGYQNNRYDSTNGGGFQCWNYGLDGIVMGEYYILTKDKSLLPAMKSLAVCMEEAQDPTTGGYMHRPYPFITKRIAEGGPKGYGSMAGTAGFIFLAQSIFRAGDIEYSEQCYERLHQAYLNSVGPNGEVGYGFKGWDHAVIEPTGDSRNVFKGARGIGYEIPGGMEGIKDFKIIWPTQADPRYKPTDWIKNEADKVRVFVASDNRLTLIRDMSLPELKGPVQHNGRTTGHIFRSGTAALGHAIGHNDDKSWQYMADHLADSCANSPNALLDGHASTLMHSLWGSLGASRSSERGFRNYMDGIKWWFIMAQTHDGGFVAMPGRDYASTDHVYATRKFPTATAALILSVKDAKIQITGAGSPRSIPKPSGSENDTASRPNKGTATPDLALLGGDFKVVHCTREAEMFTGQAPYIRVLQALDRSADGAGEKAEEAAEFARRVRGWLDENNRDLIDNASVYPARTVARAREHLRRLEGIEDINATVLGAVIENLSQNREVRALSRYYELFDEIVKTEAERGKSDATTRRREQLAVQVQQYAEKSGLPDRMAKEARSLLDELKAE